MNNNKIKTSIVSMIIGVAISSVLFFTTSATTVESSNSESINLLYQEVDKMDKHIAELEVVKTASTDPMVGEILMFAGNYPPEGYALCDGTMLTISDNSVLYSILGTRYGGDGKTTFKLPDFRGRATVHSGGAEKYPLGKKGTLKSKIMNHGDELHDEEIFTKGTEGYVVVNYIIATRGLFPTRK